jgi:hypothetical protein
MFFATASATRTEELSLAGVLVCIVRDVLAIRFTLLGAVPWFVLVGAACAITPAP